MPVAFQPSLFGAAQPGVTPLERRAQRTPLSRGAWIDTVPGWLTGADELFGELVERIPWRAESRQMYDRVVDVPRLVHTYGVGEPLPHPALVEAREALTGYYADELGEPFVTAGCCYYRDGSDSVAWHGDNLGRGRTGVSGSPRRCSGEPLGVPTGLSWRSEAGEPKAGGVQRSGGEERRGEEDTMVAIVSLGSPRKLLLRPVGGTTTVAHAIGHGDLLVMGGSCQRTWEHAVPKTHRPVGPRISVQFRPRNVF